jgi:hypothetical protein
MKETRSGFWLFPFWVFWKTVYWLKYYNALHVQLLRVYNVDWNIPFMSVNLRKGQFFGPCCVLCHIVPCHWLWNNFYYREHLQQFVPLLDMRHDWKSSELICNSYSASVKKDHCIVQVACRSLFTIQVRVNISGILMERGGARTNFIPSTFVLPVSYHSTNAPYLFIFRSDPNSACWLYSSSK